MVRKLIDYLPPIIQDVREYKALLLDGEQLEVSDLWDAVEAAFNDQFLQSATDNGVSRWEKILEIRPKATDSLDARKFRILSRVNENLPYTLIRLNQMLEALCGADGFSTEVQNNTYTLIVKVNLVAKSNFDDVDSLLKRIVPANMIIVLELKYNTWQEIKAFTWGYLKNKTWREIKEEVL